MKASKPESKAAAAPASEGQQPPAQSLEMVLLQFNDHARNIAKSISAMGDIATLLYNEVAAREKAQKPGG